MGEDHDVEVGPGRQRGHDPTRPRWEHVLLVLGLLRPLVLAGPQQVPHRPLVPFRRPVATLREDQQRLVGLQRRREPRHVGDAVVAGAGRRRQEVAVQAVEQQVDPRVPLHRGLEHDLGPSAKGREDEVDQRERVPWPRMPAQDHQRPVRHGQRAGVDDHAEPHHRPRRLGQHPQRLPQQRGVPLPPYRLVPAGQGLPEPQPPASEQHPDVGPEVGHGERHDPKQPASPREDRHHRTDDVERQQDGRQHHDRGQPQQVEDPTDPVRRDPEPHRVASLPRPAR